MQTYSNILTCSYFSNSANINLDQGIIIRLHRWEVGDWIAAPATKSEESDWLELNWIWIEFRQMTWVRERGESFSRREKLIRFFTYKLCGTYLKNYRACISLVSICAHSTTYNIQIFCIFRIQYFLSFGIQDIHVFCIENWIIRLKICVALYKIYSSLYTCSCYELNMYTNKCTYTN